MSAMRIVAVAIAVLLVIIYAVGSGRLVTTNASWYVGLNAPPWQPPNAVFGLAWTYNFLALGIVGVIIGWQAIPRTAIGCLVCFGISVAFALTWAFLFYGPHELVGAAIALSCCALVTIGMVVLAFTERPILGWVLLPYQAWLIVASSLSWGYWVLNRAG